MIIRNRFMRSATTSAYADYEGIVRDPAIKLYGRLAKGGVGLIVKGHLYILDSGKAHQGMAGISSDKHIPRLKDLTNAVHQNNGRILAQINHGGVMHQQDRAGPSEYHEGEWKAREMTEDEIETIIEGYGNAAERVMQANFDGIQIHGAHGYLISQFLSKQVNKREDKWGGNLENRARFLLEVFDEVRKKVGDVPVTLKINCDDFSSEGFTIIEAGIVAKTLVGKGIDLIEISGGGRGRNPELRARAKHKDPSLRELDFAGHAELIRSITKPTPMALVYGFTKFVTMQAVIDNNIADMISMSRPFIRESNLVKNLQIGQKEVTCIRCDACSGSDVFGKKMLQCWLE
jgi:2,4-dienoyl-CoA reductase-like NADH-dependent reductase (Old Yellow Enzyme family)